MDPVLHRTESGLRETRDMSGLLPRPLFLLVAALLVIGGLPASGQVRTFTTDWPMEPGRAFPVWLDRPVAETHQATATLQVPMSAPRGAHGLALTVWFDEPADGFLRAFWVTAANESTLCPNLYEGTGLPNRRTLLLTPQQLAEPGVLTLQASGSTLPITRLRWEWLAPASLLAAQGAPVPEVLLGEGQAPAADELLGDPYLPLEDAWKQDVITAPLSDRVERITSGEGYIAPLDLAPEQARLQVLLSGVPAHGVISLRVNGVAVGPLSIELPDLSDPSYRYSGDGVWRYDGWRKASVALPAGQLRSGDNVIEFVWNEADVPAVGLKDLLLQLRYTSPAGSLAPEALGPGPDFTEIEPATPSGGQ
jgi:hypothetical protein